MTLRRLLTCAVIVFVAGHVPARAARIYKCRGTNGRWQYSDHRPHQCQGEVIVFGRAPRRPPPPHRPAAGHRAPLLRRAQRARWQATLRQLLATPVPHNPAERARRLAALALARRHIQAYSPPP
ncbi:MAG: DUF4124 domain-containing protein [Acidiferrobacter sp.]